MGGLTAQLLKYLIGFCTNLAFFGRLSVEFVSPANHHLGLGVLVVPIIGGLIVGLMARYGSKGIRGHGIPEAMEQVLINESRIPARLIWLKPLSAAISIGTGGPFGAEGPIISTGGALGSFVGQIMRVSAAERKTLLAAGAAAGMAATFGSPVSALLLAIELLLFEFNPRSIIPVALAATTASGMRRVLEGSDPIFGMPDLESVPGTALVAYVAIGAIVGVASVWITRLVYLIEDWFGRLSIHWMWWPALGAVAVGAVGYFFPRTLGVGYTNITDILSGQLAAHAIAVLCLMKLISWSVSLGSGTSGGTLAPLFTVGGAMGALLGFGAARMAPWCGIDPRLAALVGMAAIFAGASRALLASVIFAFETTRQPLGLLPLIGGCSASYLVSCLMMRQTIMTEKIARRGVLVPQEYHADPLERILVRNVATSDPATFKANDRVSFARSKLLASDTGFDHQGFPIVNDSGHLVGVVTRREVLDPNLADDAQMESLIRRFPSAVYDDCTLREAVDHMVNHGIGRLPVLSRANPTCLVGIITRSDILSAYHRRIEEDTPKAPHLRLPFIRSKGRRKASTAEALD